MKRKLILLWALAVIAGGAIWKFYPTTPVTKIDPNDMVSVARGSIENRIDVVAKVALVNKENLTFKQTGKIASVGVTEWASVKQWQVLASLDLKKIQLDIASQKISINNANIGLSNLYESYGSTEKLRSANTTQESERKIVSLGLDLESLSREQAQTMVDQNRQIAEAEGSLEVMQQKIKSLELDVEYAKKTEGESIAETQATGDSRIRSAASNAQTLLNDLKDAGSFYKKLLFIENPNDSGFNQLGTSQLRSNATFQYSGFISNSKKLETVLSSFDAKTASTAQAQSLASTTSEIAKTAAEFNATIKDLIDATLVGWAYTDTVITGYRSTISSYLSKFTGAISNASGNLKDLVSGSSVSTIQLSTQSVLASKQASLASAELDILKQKNTLQALILGKTKYELDYASKTRSKQLEIESAKSSLELSKKDYQDLLAGPKTTEIEQKKNDILQSQNTLAVLQESIRDYQIIAPMDGIVTLIGIRAGKTSTSTEWITVENRDTIQLKSLVDQSQVVKIKIWVPVKVTFDAYKQRSFDAKISFIESVPTETSGVVSYTVKFVMNKPEWIELYDSMTASARILIDTIADVVVIPLAAVQEDKEGKFVQLYERGSLRRQAIITGKSDAINTEIKEWLKWGERVAIKAYVVTTAAKSSFSFPGAGGWQRRSNNAWAPTP